jgi:hypothetical protein
MEEIRKIATIFADDDEFLDFIIAPLINSEEYTYSMDKNKDHKYIVNIYKKCNNSFCLDKKEIDLTGKNNFFAICDKCFTKFDSLQDLENRCIETIEDNKEFAPFTANCDRLEEKYLDRVFICYKCKNKISIRLINVKIE